MKGKKKRKRAEEKYDREEENHDQDLEQEQDPEPEPGEAQEENGDSVDLEGIPLVPSTQKPNNKNGVIFILEKASLEVAKVGKVLLFLSSL